MRFLLVVLSVFLVAAPVLNAQLPTSEGAPVDISSDGETRFEGGIAVADQNVRIIYGDSIIYCDHAEYNPDTHVVIAQGHVRIYRGAFAFNSDRAVYNLQTKELTTADFGGLKAPFEYVGDALTSPGEDAFAVRNGFFSTSDSSKPDYQIRARRVRIYPDNRIIFSNVTFLVGRVPVFWFPYVFQSLNEAFSYDFAPGYSSTFGAYLLSTVGFPITEDFNGTVHLDLRSARGPALGFDVSYTLGDRDETYGHLRTYLTYDTNPNINETSLDRAPISNSRYRLSYQTRTYITNDLVAVANINKLSDQYLLQDFYPAEFQTNPVPDNFLELQKRGEAYTLTALARIQANRFFETTERLPELNWEVARTPLFNSPLFYEGTTSVANLHRSFEGGDPNPSYGSWRIDSFHQLSLPQTYFGWLSVVPTAGVRATYYSKTGSFTPSPVAATLFEPVPTDAPPGTVKVTGSGTRFFYNAGIEASFKVSRTFEQVQERWLGLDGLRHVIQPYTDFSYVSNPTLKAQSVLTPATQPGNILPFDRLIPSTQEPTIDFPQFNAVDSIDHWTIWRIGIRNRLQTRRDNSTLNWLDIDSFVDVNFKNPYEVGPYSGLITKLRFTPVPWLSLGIDSQLPVFYRNGFTEVDTTLYWTVNPSWFVSLSDRYLSHNPSIANSNQVALQTYLRLNENWGVSVYGQYEAATGQVQEQRYAIHRDLSSWVATLSVDARDNGGGKRPLTIALSFTLKDLPQLGLPVNLPSGALTGVSR
ncbi:MAG TPA: hypothetical protein VGD78_14930 [Chthoniobacterales bacterium]